MVRYITRHRSACFRYSSSTLTATPAVTQNASAVFSFHRIRVRSLALEVARTMTLGFSFFAQRILQSVASHVARQQKGHREGGHLV
jgi:hypothetical protein